MDTVRGNLKLLPIYLKKLKEEREVEEIIYKPFVQELNLS